MVMGNSFTPAEICRPAEDSHIEDCAAGASEDCTKTLPACSQTLSFLRPSVGRRPFQVCMTRSGTNWNNVGAVLSADDAPTYIMVDEVWGPSLLQTWNQEQKTQSTQVRPGDMIVAVNETSSDSSDMVQMIKNVERGEDILLLIIPGAESYSDKCTDIPKENKPPSQRPNPVTCPKPGTKAKSHFDDFARGNFAQMRSTSRRGPDLFPHFRTLDISPAASKEAIRGHYKFLARKWHPDKNPGNLAEAKEKFQAINSAYKIIRESLDL